MRISKSVSHRTILMLVSGALLLAGLLASYVWSVEPLSNMLLVGAALIAGSDVAVRAWRALRARDISIELLVTIAASGGLLIGIYEEAAAVTFLFLLGAYLEERTVRRTRQALDDLLKTAPTTALLLREDAVEEVPVQQVRKGAIVRVRPGSRVPVDGVVVDGHSAVDESAITGEGMPAEKVPGAEVYAGTINHAGVLDVRATGVGADTTLARIIHRVEEAQEAQVPLQRFIDRFAQWYTPAMVGLSVLVFLWTMDIRMALTLLVIACPGALVIATPVAIAAGLGRAARRGMLIKGGAHLEAIGRISALVLDKTGTLTEGRPRLTDVIVVDPLTAPVTAISNGHDAQSQQVLWWAAIAEADSRHPLARPIMEEAERLGPIPRASHSEAALGRGVRATWDGHEIVVGRKAWMDELSIPVDEETRRHLDALHEDGKSAVLVAVDGTVQGVLGVADTLCEAAPAVIAHLPEIGITRVAMATGDDPRVAQAVGQRAGIAEVHARQMPDDKLALIRALQNEGHVVAFAGDGINDAPALTAADVGIAMGAAGTDVATEAADLALMTDDLTRIPEAMHLSRKTLRIIRQNLALAVGTAAALLGGVLLGSVHMGSGMLIHQASLLLVVLNSMRLLSSGRTPSGTAALPACKGNSNGSAKERVPRRMTDAGTDRRNQLSRPAQHAPQHEYSAKRETLEHSLVSIQSRKHST